MADPRYIGKMCEAGCGKLATTAVRDMFEGPPAEDFSGKRWATWNAAELHYYCDNHSAGHSRLIRRQGE